MKKLSDWLYAVVIRYWPLLLLAGAVVALLMRVHWAFRVLAAALVVLVFIGVTIGLVVSVREWLSGGGEPAFLRKLRLRITQSRARLTELREEIQQIQEKMHQLGDISTRADEAGGGKQWGKSLSLARGYEEQLKLREEKVAFYRRSLQSFESLQHKWEHERQLKKLQRDLEKLREPTPEEREQMTALKTEIERESALLNTYQSISKQLDAAARVDDAKALRGNLDDLLQR